MCFITGIQKTTKRKEDLCLCNYMQPHLWHRIFVNKQSLALYTQQHSVYMSNQLYEAMRSEFLNTELLRYVWNMT